MYLYKIYNWCKSVCHLLWIPSNRHKHYRWNIALYDHKNIVSTTMYIRVWVHLRSRYSKWAFLQILIKFCFELWFVNPTLTKNWKQVFIYLLIYKILLNYNSLKKGNHLYWKFITHLLYLDLKVIYLSVNISWSSGAMVASIK